MCRDQNYPVVRCVNHNIIAASKPSGGLAMSAMGKTMTCRNVVVGTPHTSEVCPRAGG
jgi:hypothetical protein